MLLGCRSDGTGEGTGPTSTSTQAAGAYSIEIIAPQRSATVATSFDLEVAVEGIDLELGPNAAPVPGAAHWHLKIDGQLQPTPYGEATAVIGPIEAGRHAFTAGLYLNDADAVPVDEATIEIVVE
jgi:hypothetical protein